MEKSLKGDQTIRDGSRDSKTAVFAFLSSEPILVGLNVLLLVSFLVYFFKQRQPEQGFASDIPPSIQYVEVQATSTREPSPSPSPTPVPTKVTSTPTRLPSLTPTSLPPTPIPNSASIDEIRGYKQAMPLSCEARSAVDWAAYFGEEIDEIKFFNGLPNHDNPELGFVGDVYGRWGQIPPNDYGVHAQPIAQRLREYGLQAMSVRHMTLDELKAEIAAGRPVILWVVGHVKRGTPVPYTASDGEETIVAKFEHTVIAIGYTETKIRVLDGARKYYVYNGEFMKSWSVLENQAVIWID
jgi:uncharacterized protein YvpB